MARLAQNPLPAPPRAALLVETSKVYGRGILRGIARYGREENNTFYGEFDVYDAADNIGE
jgi:hypothetical protein